MEINRETATKEEMIRYLNEEIAKKEKQRENISRLKGMYTRRIKEFEAMKRFIEKEENDVDTCRYLVFYTHVKEKMFRKGEIKIEEE